uniref:Uncharacterized protein n=1 Tax=Magnetococcus massalia (strain MO-1) TaxID=451514 RepID=A0A1S7LF93_MAGMO|nr:Conserved protein of unknown function [Candidatus Magnetococcus massalia]
MDTNQHDAGSTSPDPGSDQGARDRREARKKRRMKGIAAFRAAAQEISDRARQNRQAHERGEDVAAKVSPAAAEAMDAAEEVVKPQAQPPQPKVSKPEISQPKVSKPEISQPKVSKPENSQPKVDAKPQVESPAQEPSHDATPASQAVSQPKPQKAQGQEVKPVAAKPTVDEQPVVDKKAEPPSGSRSLADNLLRMNEGSSKPTPEPVERLDETPLSEPDTPPKPTVDQVRERPVEAQEHEPSSRDHDVLAKLVKQKLAMAKPRQMLTVTETKPVAEERDEATVEVKPEVTALASLEKASRERAVELERHLHDERLLRPQPVDEGGAEQDDEEILDASYLAVRPRGVKTTSQESAMSWPEGGWGQPSDRDNGDPQEGSQKPIPATEVTAVAADQTKIDLPKHPPKQPWFSGSEAPVRPVEAAEQEAESPREESGSIRKAVITLDEVKQRMLTLEPEAPWFDMAAPKIAAEPKEPVRPVPQVQSRTVFDTAAKAPVEQPQVLTPHQSEPATTLADMPPTKAAPSAVEMDTLTQRLFESKSQDPWHSDTQVAANPPPLPESLPSADVEPPQEQEVTQQATQESTQEIVKETMQHHPEVSQQRQLMNGWMDLLTTLPNENREVEQTEDQLEPEEQGTQPWMTLLNQQPSKKRHEGGDRLSPEALQVPQDLEDRGGPWLTEKPVEPAVMDSLTVLEQEEVAPPSFVANLQQGAPTDVEASTPSAEESAEQPAQDASEQDIQENVAAQAPSEQLAEEEVTDQDVALQADEKDKAEQPLVEKEAPKEVSLLSQAVVSHRKKRSIHSEELRQLRSFMGEPLVRGPWGVESEDPFVVSPLWRYRTVAIQRRKKSLDVAAIPFGFGSLKTHHSSLRPGENQWGEMFESLTSRDTPKQKKSYVEPCPPSLSMEIKGMIFNDELLGGMDAMRWHLGDVSALSEHIHLPCDDDGAGVRRSGFVAPASKQHAIISKNDQLCFVGSPFDPMKRQRGRSFAPRPIEVDGASKEQPLPIDNGLAQQVEQFEKEQQLSNVPLPKVEEVTESVATADINEQVAEPVATVDNSEQVAESVASADKNEQVAEPVATVDNSEQVAESVTSADVVASNPEEPAAGRVEKKPRPKITHIRLPAKVRPSASKKPGKRLRAKVVRRDKPLQEPSENKAVSTDSAHHVGNEPVAVIQPQQVVKPTSPAMQSSPAPQATRSPAEQSSPAPKPARSLPVDQYVEAVEVESLSSGVANLLGDAVGGIVTSARWTGGKVQKMFHTS